MTRSILVGYDGREQGRDALVLARLLARLRQSELIVVSVLAYSPTEVEFAQQSRGVEEEGARLADEARAVLEGVGPVETLTLTSPSVARSIHDVAEQRDVGLIVLGSTHRGAIGRVLPGSTGERLLAAGPGAVAVAPRGFADRDGAELRRVGVGYDGSPESRRALGEASAVALAAGGVLRILSVLDPRDLLSAGWAGMAPVHAYPEDREARRAQLERDLAAALETLPSALEARAEVLEGDAAEALIAVSEELDVLVIGSRGYGPLKRVLLGGLSATVIREAACPVLVLPRGGSHDDTGGDDESSAFARAPTAKLGAGYDRSS